MNTEISFEQINQYNLNVRQLKLDKNVGVAIIFFTLCQCIVAKADIFTQCLTIIFSNYFFLKF